MMTERYKSCGPHQRINALVRVVFITVAIDDESLLLLEEEEEEEE